jgi:hypothetical protein
MPIKETNYLKPFCDWKQLWEETEFEVYNGDTSIVYKPMPIPSELKHYERMLEWFADEEYDDYEHFPKWEAVRNPDVEFCCKNRCDTGGHRSVRYNKFPSKPKENK